MESGNYLYRVDTYEGLVKWNKEQINILKLLKVEIEKCLKC